MERTSQHCGRYKKDLSTDAFRTKVARRKSLAQKESRHQAFRKSRRIALCDLNVSPGREAELSRLLPKEDPGALQRLDRLRCFKEERELRRLREQRERAKCGGFKCGVYRPDAPLIVPSAQPGRAAERPAAYPRVTRSTARNHCEQASSRLPKPAVNGAQTSRRGGGGVEPTAPERPPGNIPRAVRPAVRPLQTPQPASARRQAEKENRPLPPAAQPRTSRAAPAKPLPGRAATSRPAGPGAPQSRARDQQRGASGPAERRERGLARPGLRGAEPQSLRESGPESLARPGLREPGPGTHSAPRTQARERSFAPLNFQFQPLDGVSAFSFNPGDARPKNALLTPGFCWSPAKLTAAEKGCLLKTRRREKPVSGPSTLSVLETVAEPETTEETMAEPEATEDTEAEPETVAELETIVEPETTETMVEPETVAEPETTKETVAKPQTTEETMAEPDTTETMAEPDTTETMAEPDTTEETLAEPETTEETRAEPDTLAEQETTEETVAEPDTTETMAEPETTEETIAELKTTEELISAPEIISALETIALPDTTAKIILDPAVGVKEVCKFVELAHDVAYFRDILRTEIEKLTLLCVHWDQHIAALEVPEDASALIRTTVGQTRLLIKERFKQFEGLVDDCEFKRGEKETTCTDLDGFWDMVNFQIEDVLNKFSNLSKLRDNGWQQKQNQARKVLKKKIVPSVQPKSSQQADARAAARKRLAAIKAAMKEQIKQEDKLPEASDPDAQKEQADKVVFDAGFFRVESPAKSAQRSSSKAHRGRFSRGIGIKLEASGLKVLNLGTVEDSCFSVVADQSVQAEENVHDPQTPPNSMLAPVKKVLFGSPVNMLSIARVDDVSPKVKTLVCDTVTVATNVVVDDDVPFSSAACEPQRIHDLELAAAPDVNGMAYSAYPVTQDIEMCSPENNFLPYEEDISMAEEPEMLENHQEQDGLIGETTPEGCYDPLDFLRNGTPQNVTKLHAIVRPEFADVVEANDLMFFSPIANLN